MMKSVLSILILNLKFLEQYSSRLRNKKMLIALYINCDTAHEAQRLKLLEEILRTALASMGNRQHTV